MTPWSRFFAVYPALAVGLSGAALLRLVFAPSWAAAAGVILALYGFPLATYRLLILFSPLREGVFDLAERKFSSWWASHQIQAIYIAVPQLEAVLKLVPGLFSLWLRLWGSSVGTGVYWTPRAEFVDRGLLDIGDRVVFGHKVECFSHVIRPKGDRVVLYVRRISIGDGVFLGAGTRIGPGVRIEDGTSVPILSDLYPNRKVRTETFTSEVGG